MVRNGLGKRRSIDSHEKRGLKETFVRWIILVISIRISEALKAISKAVKKLGRWVKPGFLKRWTKYDTIKEVKDTRLDLDPKISREDPRYISALAMMASKTAYENRERVQRIVQDHWKMDFVDFYDCLNEYVSEDWSFEMRHSTQAFIFSDNTGDHELIWVSFRGTKFPSVDDLCTDLDLSLYPLERIGRVHLGFLKALGAQKDEEGNPSWPTELDSDKTPDQTFAYYLIRQVLREKLERNKDARFIVTGHSLGAALAVLFTTILGYHKEDELLDKLEGVYTFAQPKVGDSKFCEFMERLLGARYFRFVYGNDLIPRLPPSTLGYQHFGKCYYFNAFYQGKVLKETPDMPHIVWQRMIAYYEFVRGYIILPIFHGKDYKEGTGHLRKRLLGMLTIPGLSAHHVQDYVNLTRLGSRETFSASLQDNRH